jgi:MATE family multidrug resistance protein
MTTLTRPRSKAIASNSALAMELSAIIGLALPLFITQLGVSAIGFIDTMMAGHYGRSALAGVAVGSSICFPFVFALNGVMMAVTPITAHLTGAGQTRAIAPMAREALWLGLVFSIVLFALVDRIDPLLGLMQLEDEVAGVVQGYLRGISFGLPAAAAYFVLKSVVEGLGRTRPQMVISTMGVGFNYLANDALIHGRWGFPELGGAGCGVASGLTFWFFLCLILGYIQLDKRCRQLHLFSALSLPGIRGMVEILKLGLPIGGTLFMECSIFACITLFVGVLGPVVVGGHQITLNYSGLIFAIPLSIGMAITIRAGHALGRNEPEAARFACITGCSLAVGLAFFTLALTRFFPGTIAAIYTQEPEVAAVAVSLLKICALYQVSDAVMTTSQAALRGYKDANMTFVMTFTAYWVITLPLGYVLAMTDLIGPPLGAKGFWISLFIGLTLSGILLCLRLNRVSSRAIQIRRPSRFSQRTPTDPHRLNP